MDRNEMILGIENKERMAIKKIFQLKRIIMTLNNEELDLLLSDLDDLISLLEPSVRVEKNYEFYNTLKKTLKKKETYDLSRL